MSTFSALDRAKHLEELSTETFDLLVIGGGATGCGIALDAAARGMKTALVEKLDFAGGTSSKSTKLIHGGLRYLKQFEIGLVRESGTERAIVHQLAPHLVLPEKMLLPLIEGGTFGKFSTSLGLWVYDALAGVEGDDKRKMLTKEEALEIEPLLDESILKGGGFYAEYRTDDARLTIELIKTAARHGATAVNHCPAVDFVEENGRVTAIICEDLLTGNKVTIKARQIVSAGGPWVDNLRKKNDGNLGKKRLHLTKGVHLVFPYEKLPLSHSVYFDVPDGRMVFAIPRGRTTYVGTTDTNYTASLDRVVATKDDAEYLLNAANQAFPKINLTIDDIESNWAGLRALIHEEGKSPSELSRKDEIFEADNGLISIAGGKLTGYRKMAQRIVDLVEKRLPDDYEECTTKSIPLTNNSFKDADAVEAYISYLEKIVAENKLPEYYAFYLATNYGTQAEIILKNIQNHNSENPEINFAKAETVYCIKNEMVNSASDYFMRRTGRLFFDIPSIPKIRETVMGTLAELLNWNEERLEKENAELDILIQDATTYYEKEIML